MSVYHAIMKAEVLSNHSRALIPLGSWPQCVRVHMRALIAFTCLETARRTPPFNNHGNGPQRYYHGNHQCLMNQGNISQLNDVKPLSCRPRVKAKSATARFFSGVSFYRSFIKSTHGLFSSICRQLVPGRAVDGTVGTRHTSSYD